MVKSDFGYLAYSAAVLRTEVITPLLSKPGELVIDRQGDYPSFGGLLTMRVMPMIH